MHLPKVSVPFLKKKPETNYFLSLLIRDEQISAYILQELNGQLQIIGKEETVLPSSIEQSPPEEWIEIFDKVISKAEETLPTDIMTHKTMFGVKESWVEESKIKKEYLTKLKKVCETLDLQPIGFLVISEAIAHRLQEQEGAPLTAILIEIGKTQLTVSHIRVGKTVETKHTIIVDTPAKTVDALLKHFASATVLPARIILFDGVQIETIAQDFISHQWSKSLPFLHMPQITPLPKGFEAKAVILGAAEQMGLRVSGEITSAMITQELPAKPSFHHTLAQQFSEQYTQPPEDSSPPEEKPMQETESPTIVTDNFGFVEEQDVAKMQAPILTEQEESLPLQEPSRQETIERSSEENETQAREQHPDFLQTLHNNAILLIEKIFFHSRKATEGGGFVGIPKALYILPVILILIVGVVLWYITQVQATVQLTLNPKIVEEKGSITFTLNAGNDFSNNVIAAKDQTVDLDGSVSTNATGKKDVGTPAKGTVTLYNSSNNSAQLSAGTTITSPNNLSFTLDKDATIASASGDIFSGTKPGTTQVSVTAKDIGTDYNLPSGEKFSIASQSNVAAKNDSAFGGGSKKQVTVVSQKDLDTLATNLPSSLQDQAKTQLQQKISGNDTLLPTITKTELSKKSFDKKLNDQATTVSLKGTVTFHQASYNKNDLQDLGKLLLKDKFTDGESLSDKGIQTDVRDVNMTNDTTISGNIDLKAGLLPTLDKTKLISGITGKTVSQAKDILANEPQVQSSTIQLKPSLPFIPQILPRFSNHITILIQTND